ncbi:MAG: hypothetical protein V4654_15250 [Bdellovibrionota bacterium]
MKRDDLPIDVRYFLETSIDSIEQLQVLILLQTHPNKIWTTNEIAIELRSVDTSIQKRLHDLYRRNILLVSDKENEHKFLPSSTSMRALIEILAGENQLRPYQVIDAIYASPDKSILDFANAFKMRGDKS